MKRVIRFCLFLVVFGLILSNNSFFVFADNSISTYIVDDNTVVAYAYWFNNGFTDFTIYNTDNTVTTYTGTIENASHDITNNSHNITNSAHDITNSAHNITLPSITYTPSSSTSTNTSTISFGTVAGSSGNATISTLARSDYVTYNSNGNINYIRESAHTDTVKIADATITSTGSNTTYTSNQVNLNEKQYTSSVDQYISSVASYKSSVAQFNSTLKNFSSTTPSTLKDITSLNFMSGYTSISSYVSSRRIYFQENTPIIISFFSNVNIMADDITVYNTNSAVASDVTVTRKTIYPSGGGYFRHVFEFTKTSSGNANYCINWGAFTSTTKLRPVFLGQENVMTDELAQFMGYETTTEERLRTLNSKIDTLNNGTNNTNTQVSNNDSTTSTLNTKTTSYHTIETNNMNTARNNLQAVGTTNNLYNNNGFLNAVNFVSTNFMNLINLDTTNALNLTITFSLILGVALTIIGKLRN